MPEPPRGDLASLRERIRSMGGVALTSARPHTPPRFPDPLVRAGALGFAEVAVTAGAVHRREERISLIDRCRDAACEPGDVAAIRGLLPSAVRPRLAGLRPGEICVLDIESLGLRGSGVVAFLVGIAYIRGDDIVVRQYLLADAGGEAAMLDAICDDVAAHRLLLTYNGRSFDIPMLRSRCVVTRTDATRLDAPVHLDVLHAVRRLFRDRLGSCTLGQAEAGLLNMHRENDVPGAEAPARYLSWCRGAPSSVIEGVIRHNATDVVSTLLVALRAGAHVGGRLVEPAHPGDRYHLALHIDRHSVGDAPFDETAVREGASDGAHPAPASAAVSEEFLRESYAAGVEPWSRHAAHRLIRRWGRQGDPMRRMAAAALAAELWNSDPDDLRAARALAIALERRHDGADARDICVAVLARLERMPPLWQSRLRGAPREGWLGAWRRRHARLEAKLRGRRRVA